jgi:hypothetical protein
MSEESDSLFWENLLEFEDDSAVLLEVLGGNRCCENISLSSVTLPPRPPVTMEYTARINISPWGTLQELLFNTGVHFLNYHLTMEYTGDYHIPQSILRELQCHLIMEYTAEIIV